MYREVLLGTAKNCIDDNETMNGQRVAMRQSDATNTILEPRSYALSKQEATKVEKCVRFYVTSMWLEDLEIQVQMLYYAKKPTK